MPATSAKVISAPAGSKRRARERPKLPSACGPAPASHDQEDQQHEQEHGAEAEQERRQQAAANRDRHRVDLDLLLDQQSLEGRLVGEGGQLTLELRGRLAVRALARPGDRFAELPGHSRPEAVDARDVPCAHLIEEDRRVGDPDARLGRVELPGQHPVRDQERCDQRQHAGSHPQWPLRRPAGAAAARVAWAGARAARPPSA